ncbi:hypothetical protein HDU84_001586 [Entophlyctis sp. JEL0112]|nr:hypothetical protein HDU84_001586 [Entophlyctis sp. JEL0112]
MARLLGGNHTHTWRGFVRDTTDAAVLVEACIRNLLETHSDRVSPTADGITSTVAGRAIENGTVVVFQLRESEKSIESDDAAESMARWRVSAILPSLLKQLVRYYNIFPLDAFDGPARTELIRVVVSFAVWLFPLKYLESLLTSSLFTGQPTLESVETPRPVLALPRSRALG